MLANECLAKNWNLVASQKQNHPAAKENREGQCEEQSAVIVNDDTELGKMGTDGACH